MIELRTLGRVDVISGAGTPVEVVLAQPRRLALLTFLALPAPGAFHRRDTLLAMFWPEHDSERARHALRQSLYFLRRALGTAVLVSRGDDELGLAPDQLWCDAAEFEQAVHEGRVEAALALYGGELLPGFHISDAPDFARWLDLERNRLRTRAAEAGWALAESRERDGDTAGAAAAGQAAAALEPTDEAAITRLLRLLVRLGDRGAAVRAYAGFARRLWDEYELQPSEQTRELVASFRAEPVQAATVPTATSRPATGISPSPGEPVLPPTRRRRLTGIAVGVVLLAVAWLGFGLPDLSRDAATRENARPRSVAVLPFVNLSADSTGAYFGDGVAEQILYALSQLPDLRVAARTSAFQFDARGADIPEIGRRLGVEAVMEGSVQRSGDTVRITAQLIDARTGYHIWSGRFDRPVTDLLAVEDEIARAIADTLEVSLGLATHRRRGTTDPRALDLYLRGLSLLAQRSVRPSIIHFESALARDSGFASAWAGLAAATELLPAYYLASYDQALPAAEKAARRALALDSTLGPAYTVLANIHRDRLEWREAERAYHRALALAPNDPETVQQYGQFLFWSGQIDRAVPWLERARRLDPLAPIPAATAGTALLFSRRYDSAATMLRLASSLEPTLPLPYQWLMWTELNAKRYDSAAEAARRSSLAAGLDADAYLPLIRGVADPTRRAEALAVVARIPRTSPWGLSGAYRMNWLILLGDTAGALHEVDELAARPTFFGVLNLWNPALDPIRTHPRFRATLERLGVPYRGTEP